MADMKTGCSRVDSAVHSNALLSEQPIKCFTLSNNIVEQTSRLKKFDHRLTLTALDLFSSSSPLCFCVLEAGFPSF